MLKRATTRWLKLEGEGRDSVAEKALGRVFRSIPMPAPSRSLVERTLVELGLDPSLVARNAPTPHWTFRWAVSLALTLSGLATALYLPTLLASLSLKGSANWIVDVGAGALTAISRRLAAGMTVWDVVWRAGQTAAEVVATPQLLALMLATVLLGLATLRLLGGLVVVERSSYHA